jgi:hypothetical protein
LSVENRINPIFNAKPIDYCIDDGFCLAIGRASDGSAQPILQPAGELSLAKPSSLAEFGGLFGDIGAPVNRIENAPNHFDETRNVANP